MQITYSYTNVIDLLGKNSNQLLIPRYQRDYSWNYSQAKILMQDIINALSIEKDKVNPTQYFFGTLLMSGDITATDTELEIVDGQQRITTIIILLSAICANLNKDEPDERELYNKIMNGQILTKRYGDSKTRKTLLIESVDDFYYKYLFDLQDENQSLPILNEADESIKTVFDYFYRCLSRENIKDTFRTFSTTKDQESFERPYNFLVYCIYNQLRQLMIAILTTPSMNEATSIFESLNSKGKPLTQSDLIKNKIFSNLTKQEPIDTAKSIWKQIKNHLDKTLTSKTFVPWVSLEDFIQVYWKANISSKSTQKIYEEFKSRFGNDPKKTMDFLNDLNIYSKEYKVILGDNTFIKLSDEGSFQIKRYLNLLTKSLKIKQVYPLLLQLIHCFNKQLLKEKQIRKIFKFLADFHFLYNGILKEPANRLNGIYGNASRDIRDVIENFDLTKEKTGNIDKILKSTEHKLQKLLPAKRNEFSSQIAVIPPMRYTNKSEAKKIVNEGERTKYILYSYTVEKNENRSLSDMTVEHIIPDDPNNLDSISLGNLVLLEKEDNEKIKTDVIKKKVEVYKTSKNKDITELVAGSFFDQLESPNPRTIIRERQRDILMFIYDCIIKMH